MLLVLGGARSGKSHYAENQARERADGNQVLYIATAIAFDDDMKERVKRHQAVRPENWCTREQFKSFGDLRELDDFIQSKVVLVDCVTLLVSNLLLEYPVDFDHIKWDEITLIEEAIKKEVDDLVKVCEESGKILIMVSNEVGLGVVPPYRLGNIFRDIAGRINQQLASSAEEVVFLVSGLPMILKK